MGFLERKAIMLGIVLASMILLLSTGLISFSSEGIMVHAQKQQLPPSSESKPIGVKITSPIRGQQVPIGNNLTLSGISKYNSTSNCQVFVILDGIRPYQKTIPVGLTGTDNNYSNWKYSLGPTYPASIKVGTNKITAKLLCQASPADLTKFYSINVTGVNQTIPKFVSTSNTSGPASFLPISSNTSLLNPIFDRTSNNTKPTAGNTGSVHRTSSSNNDNNDENQHHQTSSSNGNGHHHIKNSSSDNESSHHHNNNAGGGKSDLAHKIITHIKKRFGIG